MLRPMLLIVLLFLPGMLFAQPLPTAPPESQHSRPIDKVYQEADAMGATSMDEFVGIAATLPLAFQPGERFAYGLGIDVIGAIGCPSTTGT